MTNCQLMNGLDWRTIGYAEYQTRLAHWNEAHHSGPPAVDMDKVRKAMAGAGGLH